MPSRELTYAEAIREALDQVMAEDENVLLIGEGVPDPKNIFGTTSGLREKYGENRVFDMPLSENGLTGVCIGAAQSGLRPVMVHQRNDFMMLAMDQLVNHAAKWRYLFGDRASIPMVVRAIIGRGWGQGPQHAQSLQSLFAHIPGLRVVMPSNAHDAKGMLIAAIKDNNPVIFLEHRWLHHTVSLVPENAYEVTLDNAVVARSGEDITLVAFSYMTLEALRAAEWLSEHAEISVEILDMRSVRPLDMNSVLLSVNKTGRLLVLDTAWKTGGVSAEVIAGVAESGRAQLKCPPVRITLPDRPAPTSVLLSADYYPEAEQVAGEVIRMMGMSDDVIRLTSDLQRAGPIDVPNHEFKGPF